MGWEVVPEGIYKILKQFAKYPVNEIIITENGAAFHDNVTDGCVHDTQRITYFRDYLKNVLKAKNEGVNVTGYFIWTFIDNFEWAQGFDPRFGLYEVDYKTFKRTPRKSALLYQKIISKNALTF